MYGPAAQVTGGEFVTNYRNYWLEQSWSPRFFEALSLPAVRGVVGHLLSLWILFTQRMSYGCHISTSSPESYDETLAKELVGWSQQLVDNFENAAK